MDIQFFLIGAHVIGTIIGVGGATMIEAHINQAYRDKLISADERSILGIDYRMVRIGLIVCILSGFGFLLLDKFEGNTKYLYSPTLWAKIVMVLIIAVNTLLLQAHKINLYWGSSLSFVSWWMAAFFGMIITHGSRFDFFGVGGFVGPFASYIVLYMLAVTVGAMVLHIIRNRITSPV